MSATRIQTAARLTLENQALRAENARLRRRIARLEALAATDPLTGLGNRRYFDLRLEQECSRARRRPGRFSVCLLDVDGMKAINDRGGHEAGDRALTAVGAALSRELRAQDLSCRIGGDEFALILPDTDRASAARLTRRLRRALLVSVSVGAATWDDDGTDAAALLRRADARMYRDKRRRRSSRSAA